jgi:hypothetical protein
MLHGNVLPLRSLHPFPFIAGLPAHWYNCTNQSSQSSQSPCLQA